MEEVFPRAGSGKGMGHGNEIAEKSQAKVKSEVNMAATGHHRQLVMYRWIFETAGSAAKPGILSKSFLILYKEQICWLQISMYLNK